MTAAWLLLAVLPAQEIDTVIFEKDRKAFRLLDQVESAAERASLENIFTTRDPAERLRRAEAFLSGHPDSAFLSVVYEVAARSCIDLRRPQCVWENAARSLRLLPENPLLLVSLAEAQAAAGHKAGAQESARRALHYLDRFAPPSGYTPAQWKALEPKLRASAIRTLGVAPATRPRPRQGPARYAGTDACKSCHTREHQAWSMTGMARMLRPYRPENVFGKFGGDAYRENGLLIRAITDEGRHWFELKGQRFPVDYTIGSKWQQAYATKMPDGRIQVFPIQYNRLTGGWINYWRGIDPPGSARAEAVRFLDFGETMNYQINCVPCHTSQSRLHGAEEKAEAIGYAEPGVNCEMCHGPSAGHAAGGPANFSFARLDAQSYVDICAQCHRQSAIFQPGARGERNYSGLAPDFTLNARSRPYIEFSRKAFFKDGRFRETTFIVEAFERTKCFQKGGAHCGHCHNPHPADAPANLKSLKFVDQPDRMCTGCHPKNAGRQHTRHVPGSEGSQCVACHMPKITNTVGFRARTHRIDDIPDAAMTVRFGPAGSPNACLACHPGEDPAALLRTRTSAQAGSNAAEQRR
ncbi:MAG: cytochrome c3 family protein [Bryobacteraceae bacterium]|nr:cytochrome c3 family protein [Bryobacteraceae bacterium]